MCNKCKKTSCSGCGGGGGSSSQASLEAQFAELQETVVALSSLAAPFLKGHPIVVLEHADDIALFDLSTGKGSGDYALYAVCDGKTHKSIRDNKNIVTPNLIDRFLVQAAGTYAVDDTGGAATVALSVAELPVHNHAITDPGHTHTITDPGHVHAIDDDMHTHAASGGAHTHGFTTDSSGAHTHQSIGSALSGPDDGSLSFPNLNAAGTSFTDHLSDGAHTHGGTTDSASASVAVTAAATGIEVLLAYTGITAVAANIGITETEDTGSGDAHENLPPYYAVLMVMLIG